MCAQKHRGRLSRMGKSALDIFESMPEPVAIVEGKEDAVSLLETAPMLAWGLWWQDMCYLQTCRVTRFWYP